MRGNGLFFTTPPRYAIRLLGTIPRKNGVGNVPAINTIGPIMPLAREEYVEQAYFFKMLRERMQQSCSTQEILAAAKQEVLSTTQLPYALDFMATELRHTGGFATAMSRLGPLFHSFSSLYCFGGGTGGEKIRFPHRPRAFRSRGRIPY